MGLTTQTHALLAGNPASSGSNAGACPATDQRGFTRAGRCDIGAFEFGAILLKDTATTLISSMNPARIGQPITFTATVSTLATEAGTPSGSVTFHNGATTLGSSTLDSNGRAAFTIDGLAAGSNVIAAFYSGDANYAPSTSAHLNQIVSARKLFMPLLQR